MMAACLKVGTRFIRTGWHCLQKRKHSTKPSNVKGKLELALKNYKELELVPLRILECSLGGSFSKARLKYEEFIHPSDNAVYHDEFSKVFERGFTWLERNIDSEFLDIFSTENGDHFYAFNALLTFLYEIEYHESCLKDKKNPFRNAFDNKKEGEVAALLTNHLLSRLIHGNKYVISNDYQMRPSQCPCLISCLDNIHYGQTGLGHEELWFGHPDIVLIPPQMHDYMPLWFTEEFFEETANKDDFVGRDDGLRSNDKTTDMCEIKGKNVRFDTSAEQILSQAITFAFYQSNVAGIKGIPSMSTVIPSLVLTPIHYYIVMYDYLNDILLSSGHRAASLWDESKMKFNLSAVLHIWMVLNYIDFMPSLGPEGEQFFAGSCNFHKILQRMHLFEKTKKITHKSSFQSHRCIHPSNRKNFREYIMESKKKT